MLVSLDEALPECLVGANSLRGATQRFLEFSDRFGNEPHLLVGDAEVVVTVEVFLVDVGGDTGLELLQHVGEVRFFALFAVVVLLGDHAGGTGSVFTKPITKIDEIVFGGVLRCVLFWSSRARCFGGRRGNTGTALGRRLLRLRSLAEIRVYGLPLRRLRRFLALGRLRLFRFRPRHPKRTRRWLLRLARLDELGPGWLWRGTLLFFLLLLLALLLRLFLRFLDGLGLLPGWRFGRAPADGRRLLFLNLRLLDIELERVDLRDFLFHR